LSLIRVSFNTAVGYFSLRNDTQGAFNSAVGAGALLANAADQNRATGAVRFKQLAGTPLPELARVRVPIDHIASFIVNANDGVM
jgi:hypothetical protein